jgi:predicted nucleotidyltransferase component of viral defense system
MARLLDRRAIHIATLEVSFNELVCEVDEIYLGEGDESILAYSVYDLVAEKLRALLQQTQRNRFRRQDVYDIALILRDRKFDVEEREKVLQTLLAKARSREIEPDADAIEMPEIIERARSEYGTLKLELGDQPLDFDADFGLVADFYRSLPWD